MHALVGSNSFRTMTVKGVLKGRTITILIDSGSTHNFIEPGVVKISGYKVEVTPNLSVIVADGTKLCSKAVCKTFKWEMQGLSFTTKVRVLPIRGCDMVLGILWLSTLGPIYSMGFQKLEDGIPIARTACVSAGGCSDKGGTGYSQAND